MDNIKRLLYAFIICIIAYLGPKVLNIKISRDLFLFLIFLMLIQGFIFSLISRKEKYLRAIIEIVIINLILYFEGIFIFKRLDILYKYFSYEELGGLAWDGSLPIIVFSICATILTILSYIFFRKLIELFIFKFKNCLYNNR
ncbi:hypothetical protein OEG88_14245 (plasmid) [Clostridium perfringens]|uniref:hypothetical protein n=1 Tax=Clostridium perfringens TaxID=1502 RepID=UPI001A2B16FF|nr:hypothetical protein [Clostridium perfringens]UYC94376.1 hypothetical protein OEG88_14245 [Clostridium perfringens]HAT4187046.1 hypothetical protein [Clostridium perfringens]HAT4189637.1 hypothetical protein [Clostridium perfringens]HAT4195027.1 hypothetical protein [Clostridium perfringens]HAT4197600.1 hypothetical protein [Clostridium perfringens]